MGFKDKLKPVKTSALRDALDEDEKYVGTNKGDGHKLETGINKFRFYPPHPGEPSFFKLRGAHWGKIEGEGGDAVSRKVPDGQLHGGLSVDPIEYYITLCQQKIDGSDPKQMVKLEKLTNNRDGLQKKISWEAYADKWVDGKPVFDIFEFKKPVREAIKKESIIDDAEEALEVDPFTDPEEGRMLVVDYNAAAKKPKDYYKSIRLGKNPTALTEEQCEHFVTKVKPLSQLPEFQYTQKHFETALEIVRYFDEENDVNLFDSEEYQEKIAQLKKELKRNGTGAGVEEVKGSKKKVVTDDEDDAPPVKKVVKKAVVADDDEEEEEAPAPKKPAKKADKFEAMDRDELKEYIAENELEVVVKKSHTEADIRNNIRTAIAEAESKVAEEEDDDEEEAPPVNVKKAKKVTPPVTDDDEEEEEEEAPKPKKKANLDGVKAALRGGA